MISHKRISIKFILIVLFCVLVSGDAEVRCIASEREALLSFKNGLIDEDGILSSWLSNECCQWHGVECSNTTGHVTTLHLNNDDYDVALQGEVRSSLNELNHLNYLDLSGNDFGGIPIPKLIGSMKQLQHLYLRNSNFSGTIPIELGNLTKLSSLDLSFNFLRNENLDWLSSLSLLSSLDLSQIVLSSINWLPQILSHQFLHELHLAFCNIGVDSFPTSISILGSALESLEILDLSFNYLNGSIPDLGPFSSFTELHLSGNYFTGSIPQSIGQLTKLQILDLSFNSLEGLVPPNIGQTSKLEYLDLSDNYLEGSVPRSIGQLSKLRVLDLSSNYFENSMTESHFTKLDKLETLDLSSNSLVLHVASDWSPPFQLRHIYLVGCNVGPYFPKWIRTQRNLLSLDLSGANITDEAPRWLWSISSLLEILYLPDNKISGTIPNLLSTSIQRLDLSNNEFSGPIPLFPANVTEIQLSGNMFSGTISSICKTQHDQLNILHFSNNQLEGEVPDCWEKMSKLYSLILANNNFSGEIPLSLGNLHHLVVLQMRDNNLSGELPYSLRRCQELYLIDVGRNKLVAEIPTWIGKMYNMHFLNLHGNKFHGSIPVEICNLTYIQVLDLSMNNLSSTIHDCFNNLSVMATKNYQHPYPGPFPLTIVYSQIMEENKRYGYSSFQWKGQNSEYRKNLEFLKLIDFSSNRLIGTIPRSFSNMMGLNSLNLSRNSLTGNIIPDIGKLEMLDSLDLSHNQLSGKIPTSLAEIYTLSVLDLSNNNLSGNIPTGTQLQSFNASAYAGNDGLCGDPLPKCPEDRSSPSTTNPVENMNEKDDHNFSFMEEVGISMGFGFIFGFWGVIGSLILKKSWRIAFFNLFDVVGDWFYVRIVVFVSKWRQS